MGGIILDTITATTISAKTIAAYPGGGRLIYADQDQAFSLKMVSSTITCQASAYVAGDSTAISAGTYS